MTHPDSEHARRPLEAQRAWERFASATEALNATIVAMSSLRALPESREHVATDIRLRHGAKAQHSSDAIGQAAEDILDAIEAEFQRDCVTIKEAALVAACSSFEYLIKAFFVDGALQDPEAAAAGLRPLRLKIDAADVLGVPRVEQWFAIADRAFEEVGRAHPKMSVRVQKFLLEHTAFVGPAGSVRKADVAKAFDEVDGAAFNEAFLTRNCIVHNGGRVDIRLSPILKIGVGEPLPYPRRRVPQLIKPLRDLGWQLSPLWFVSL